MAEGRHDDKLSPYKYFNIFKALVGVTPGGCECFVPDLWGGQVGDTQLVGKSALVDLFQPGDALRWTKGFIWTPSCPQQGEFTSHHLKGETSSLLQL